VVLDGARFTRATNSFADLIAGVRLDLKAVGTTSLGTAPPTANLGQAVSDFVATFNELHTVIAAELDPATGALRSDPAAAGLRRSLGTLTTVALASNPTGAPRTLGDIGVRTSRDGTLTVDTVQLTKMLVDYPAAIEAMFADRATSGLSSALSAIAARATDRKYGFDAEVQRYTATRTDLSEAQAKAAEAAATMKDRLTRQFASMDARVAAYKSTQEFMKQQVDAWNKAD
jgi:flagellar hook-associated protein 2